MFRPQQKFTGLSGVQKVCHSQSVNLQKIERQLLKIFVFNNIVNFGKPSERVKLKGFS